MEKIVQSLKKEQEKPFCAYLYHLPKLRQHVNQLTSTLPTKCDLFYAVKANSDFEILKALAPIVHGFEAASLGEIEKIRQVDKTVPILFGGPGKTREEMEGAIHHGVTLLNVESTHELRLLNYIASQKGTNISILLRVNLKHSVPNAKLKMAGVPTQFGIDEQDVPHAIVLAKSLPNIRLHGFHFHAMSNNCDSKTHAEFVDHCFEKAKSWEKEWEINISYLNVGGGIGINYLDLKNQFNWADFTDRLKKVLEKHGDERWKVLFECGRYITSSCGYYAAEILDIKQNHGSHFCIVRGGSHHLRLPAAWKQSHPFTVVPVENWGYPIERPEITNSPITVAGELCTPNDVLARDIQVPRIRVGDILLFSYAGAYGWAISHHDFLSHPHPEHLYLEADDILQGHSEEEKNHIDALIAN